MFKISYPNSYVNMDRDSVGVFINLWTDAFKNIPAQIVFDAVKEIIYTETRQFAPNIGEVNEKILNMIAPETESRARDQWEKCRQFMRSSSGERDLDLPLYNKLDAVTHTIYTYRALRDMAIHLSSEQIEWRRNEFIRLYKQMSNRRNRELMQKGDLIELAGGHERAQAIGLDTELLIQTRQNMKHKLLETNEKS